MQGPVGALGPEHGKALERAGEILSVGLGAMELPPGVPHRRMVDLARYGMTATATTLRRHGPSRQLATLLATVIYLEGKSVDDNPVPIPLAGPFATSSRRGAR
ncbi:hypothetical protein [Nonomuraea bangladeshensis]|uniref:hypothetical protein n=1 Tax=Nonomuraea bangladeshensis TaxID=404385 RepID=UPI0031DAB4AE